MPELEEETKAYLNQFNKEYYGNSFEEDDEEVRVNVATIDKDTVNELKNQIRELKAKRKKIFDKSPNKTTEAHREEARMYTAQIEEIEEFIRKQYPQQLASDLNNYRNRCFVNRNRASNKIKLVSWETLSEDSLVFEDPELFYQYIIDKEKKD